MTRQLRHRKTKARGREECHIGNSWPTAPFAWTVSSREFVPHHRDEGVSATRSALLSHCLLPLCCAARTPRTPHAALALLPLVPRTRRRTTGTRQHARTTTHDDEKMLRAHTGTKPKTPIDGARENLVSPRQRGPVARAGGLLLPPMRAWLEQPHGRRHKAPPQPCALTTKSASRQLLSEIRRKLDLRVPRRPRTFARLVRKRTTSKVSYHAPLYGYAFSRIRSTTPHRHSHALRRHTRAKSLGLLSPPHSPTTIARQSHHHF